MTEKTLYDRLGGYDGSINYLTGRRRKCASRLSHKVIPAIANLNVYE